MRSETVRGALRDGGRQPLSGGKGRMVSPHSTRRTPRSTTSISGQSGPQTDFLSTPADICIYGDAAGGGKTVGLILEQLRHAGRVAGLTAVVLPAQITNPGGLWDESQNFYPRLGGIPHLGAREWRWSRGSGQHPGDHLLAEDASALARRSGAE